MVYMELHLCGLIDFVQDNGDGSVKLLDWKQSAKDLIVNARAFEYSHALGMSATSGSKCDLQLNIYRVMFEKQFKKSHRELNLVQFHPDLGTIVVTPVALKKVENLNFDTDYRIKE